MYLTGMKYDVMVEKQNYNGRADLIVNLARRRIVIEFKFSKDGHRTADLLHEAGLQLKNRQYGTENLGDRELVRFACVFDGTPQSRQITSYMTC